MIRLYLEGHIYYFSPVFAALAFLASLTIFAFPGGQKYLKIFSVFLFLNLTTDTITGYQAKHYINNLVFSNLVTVFDVTFYCFMVREIIRNLRAKKILLVCLIAYPA